MSLWLPCGLHGFAVPNTATVRTPTVTAGVQHKGFPIPHRSKQADSDPAIFKIVHHTKPTKQGEPSQDSDSPTGTTQGHPGRVKRPMACGRPTRLAEPQQQPLHTVHQATHPLVTTAELVRSDKKPQLPGSTPRTTQGLLTPHCSKQADNNTVAQSQVITTCNTFFLGWGGGGSHRLGTHNAAEGTKLAVPGTQGRASPSIGW
jgi:hypothetical protein